MAYGELPEEELLAREGEGGPWIVQLEEEPRDALADAQGRRLVAAAERWVRTGEFWKRPCNRGGAVSDEVTALAPRARQAGEHLYCWISRRGRYRTTASRPTLPGQEPTRRYGPT